LPRAVCDRHADGAGAAHLRDRGPDGDRGREAHGRGDGALGVGPAFIYIILESLAEAGVKVGLPRDTATLLAAQTTFGAAKMVLDTGYHPALLKDAVTTPAGCTIDGILELEEGGLRVTLIKAVMRATQRAKELAAG
jgi:pyrroline-5-carboxylate reductase